MDQEASAGPRCRHPALCSQAAAVEESCEKAPAKQRSNVQDAGHEPAAEAALREAQRALAAVTAERDSLRKDLKDARKQREEAFKKTVELTDALHQLANEFRELQARHTELLQKRGESKAPSPDRQLPKMEGLILTVASGIVEISLGSDAGLRAGDRLDVYRSDKGVSTYLGRIQIIEVTPDRSVGKILPGREGEIRKGDRVTTPLAR